MTIKWQQIQKSGQYWLLPDDNDFLSAVDENLEWVPEFNWEGFNIPEEVSEQDGFWDDVNSWKSSEDFLQWIEQIAAWDTDTEQWRPKYE